MSYQDRWICGETLEEGQRCCPERYLLVRSVMERYTRPVTVLDLGANLGYFGHRLAHDFGAIAVMIESRPVLEQVCRENDLSTTIALRRRLSVSDLEDLASSEHFDIVLALNIVHHFKREWRAALDAITRLGDDLIIETPPAEDVKACGQRTVLPILRAVEAMGPEKLGATRSHTTQNVWRPMYLVSREKMAIRQTCINAKKVGARRIRRHTIRSTRQEKQIAFEPTGRSRSESRDWVHGINLWTWCQLGGVYPDVSSIERSMRAAYEEKPEHGDLHPWNFILQGRRAVLIDAEHRQTFGGSEAFAKSVRWMRHPSEAYR